MITRHRYTVNVPTSLRGDKRQDSIIAARAKGLAMLADVVPPTTPRSVFYWFIERKIKNQQTGKNEWHIGIEIAVSDRPFTTNELIALQDIATEARQRTPLDAEEFDIDLKGDQR